jgi:hypothetical protein
MSLFGGNCSFFLTLADCAPAVERPSSQSAASIAARKSATSALLNTSGTQINIASAYTSSVAASNFFSHFRIRIALRNFCLRMSYRKTEFHFCRDMR